MEVRLAQRDLQQAEDRAALLIELKGPLGDRLRVALLVQAVELDEQSHRLRAACLAVDARDRFERGVRREAGRARQRAVEQKALDHAVGSDTAGIACLVRLEREARLEHRGPLQGVLGCVRELCGFARHGVGHVGRALDELPETDEVAGLVVEHRVLEQPVDQADAHLHVHQERVEVRLPYRFLHAPVERVDLLIQLRRQRGPDGLRGKPRRRDAGANRRPERPGDDHLDHLIAPTGVASPPPGKLHEAHPEFGPRLVRAVERERDVHAEDARQVVGALEMAPEQGQRCGRATQHRLRNCPQP